MEIAETEASAVKKAFELCLQGEGTVDIAQKLTSEGHRTRNGSLGATPVCTTYFKMKPAWEFMYGIALQKFPGQSS